MPDPGLRRDQHGERELPERQFLEPRRPADAHRHVEHGHTDRPSGKANGSSLAAPQNLSNSWPRWSPFVQTYNGGNRLLWVAFSSTARDYGVLVRNHLAGDVPVLPGDLVRAARSEPRRFVSTSLCQQPKLWMAAINLSAAAGADPSFPAFYLPFQDVTTHNHAPQWTGESSPCRRPTRAHA